MITVGNVQYKVTGIASKALKGNKKVAAVKIPATVTVIGASAFENCKKLKNITVKSKQIKNVGKNVFKGLSKNAKIRVPKAKIKAYQKQFFVFHDFLSGFLV